MADQNQPTPLLMPDFRVTFARSVFESKKTDKGDDRYSLTGLIPPLATLADAEKSKLQAIREAVARILVEKFGGRDKIPQGIHTPFSRAEDKNAARQAKGKGPLAGYDPGWIVFSASSSMEVEVLDNKKGPDNKWLPLKPGTREFYSGVWARCFVVPFFYSNKTIGVGLGLRGVQKLREDKAFAGGGSMADMFDPLPTGSGDALDTGAGTAQASNADLFGNLG